jgi:hypothetical protein
MMRRAVKPKLLSGNGLQNCGGAQMQAPGLPALSFTHKLQFGRIGR